MASIIDVKVDASNLLLRMQKGQKKLAFAVEHAINKTLLRAQTAVYAHEKKEFIIRNPAFFFGTPGRLGGVGGRLLKSSVAKGRAYGEISVGASSISSQRRLLLSGFEEGGPRKPATPGAKTSAAPILGRPARPSINRPVPPQYTFQGLNFRAYKGKRKLTRKRRKRTVDVTMFGEFGRFNVPEGPQRIQWKGLERTLNHACGMAECSSASARDQRTSG